MVGVEPTRQSPVLKHFECSLLRPLEYICIFNFVARNFPQGVISSAAPSTTRTTLRVYFRPVFFPEICSKIRWRENRRDGKKYSILRFSVLRNFKENQGDEIPSFCRNFECSSLQPLRYASMYKYSLLGTNHMISSQPRYDHFDTAANAALQINLLTAQLLYQKGRWQSMLTRGFATVVCQAYARGSTYSKIHR